MSGAPGHEGRKGGKGRGARDLSSLTRGLLEKVIARRTGLTLTIVESWSDLAGPELGRTTRPEKIRWGRRPHLGGEASPGTLVVAAGSAAALRLQHETDQLIERINAMFGYRAIGRIAIVQKPIDPPPEPPPAPPVDPRVRERIADTTRPIEHEALRASLRRLGEAIAARRGGR